MSCWPSTVSPARPPTSRSCAGLWPKTWPWRTSRTTKGDERGHPVRLAGLDSLHHVLFLNDPHHGRCRAILEALESGEGEGWIDPVVVHELTYVLPRALPSRFAEPAAVAEYLLSFLLLDSVKAEGKEALIASVQRWASSGVGFADARLAVLGQALRMAVCSVNERDFPDVDNTFSGQPSP